MLFTPRHPPAWRERLRIAVWPRRSFVRSARYVGWRVLRLGGSAHGLALGVAAGVFVATLPLPGLQLLLAALLAWLVRGNVPAALLGTFWANPLTVPVLWLTSHWLGASLLGPPATLSSTDITGAFGQIKLALLAPDAATLTTTYALIWPLLKPMLLGAVLIGAVTAFVFYWLTLHLIAGYRERRVPLVDQRREPDLSLDELPLGEFGGRLT